MRVILHCTGVGGKRKGMLTFIMILLFCYEIWRLPGYVEYVKDTILEFKVCANIHSHA